MVKPVQSPNTPSLRTYVCLLLAGAVMIVPVGLAGVGVNMMIGAEATPLVRNFTIAVLGSSLPEEMARFAILCFIALRRFGSVRPAYGLKIGAVVSLGFSIAENLLYGLTLGWHMALVKLAIATPIHLALGVTMGGLLVIAGRRGLVRRGVGLAVAFLLPVLLHGTYDLVILGALHATAPGTSDAMRLLLPAICYAIVIAYAVSIGRRACRLRSGVGAPA